MLRFSLSLRLYFHQGERFRFFHHSSLPQDAETVRQRRQTVPRESRDRGERYDPKFEVLGSKFLEPSPVPRVSHGSPALGYDFERVAVYVQRLVEALREGEETCPKDLDPTSHSQ